MIPPQILQTLATIVAKNVLPIDLSLTFLIVLFAQQAIAGDIKSYLEEHTAQVVYMAGTRVFQTFACLKEMSSR